jgi:catechol 2,3-dioxygenase-like lactoylglutathione lyase family enzyme
LLPARLPAAALAFLGGAPRLGLALAAVVVIEGMEALLPVAVGKRGGTLSMIEALDHIVLVAPSTDAAVADCQRLLGRLARAASFQLANVRLDVRPSAGVGAGGLSMLAFAIADTVKAQRLLQQRALPFTVAETGALGVTLEATHGVAISLVPRGQGEPSLSPADAPEEAAAVAGLDHVVIRSPDPERAVALYAGRLGLSLRLDRTEPAWGTRLLFFRCGDLIIEVAHDLKAGTGDGPDRLWGLSWRAPDLAKAHARLRAAGVDVSEIRTGRRPGTQVFSVRSHTAGVPTLMIGSGAGR